MDWEIYSSMYDGQVNKKSGVIGICLPTCPQKGRFGNFSLKEKQFLFPNSDHSNWPTISTKAEVDEWYPYMPERLRENFLANCYMPIVLWEDLQNDADRLEYLIEKAFEKRQSNKYDLSRSMMRRNLP